MRVLVRLSLRVLLRVLVGAEVRVFARVPECVLGRFLRVVVRVTARLSVCVFGSVGFSRIIYREKKGKNVKYFHPLRQHMLS